jgi:hypothetical protein
MSTADVNRVRETVVVTESDYVSLILQTPAPVRIELTTPGPAGIPGPTGAQGDPGPVGPGVAPGGDTGDLLVKVDDTDYNTTWTSSPEVDALAFDTEADSAVSEGQLAWNADERTLDLGKGGGVTLQLGQEQITLCRNSTNATIPNGTAVRFAGTIGNSGRLLVAPMVADGTLPGYVFFGVTTASIAPGQDGFVTSFGKIRGINTSAFTEGDILWCSPTTPGGFTNVEPQAPNLKLPVAAVVSAKQNGILMVRSDTGRRLADLHDVEANGTKSDGDVLGYNATAKRWEPVAPSTFSSPTLAGLDDVNVTAKQDNSVLYYHSETAKWTGDDLNTLVSISDGGNF